MVKSKDRAAEDMSAKALEPGGTPEAREEPSARNTIRREAWDPGPSVLPGVELIPENQAAVQAVMELLRRLAQGHAVSYPVVIYGPPGSGKTHLMQGAVAWWSRWTDAPVWCLSAAEWDEQLVPTEEGLLIIEDLHHLALRDAETLCQVLDRRRAFGSGLILTSGRAVAELQHLPRRLTSRLSAALVVPLWPAGVESRRRIVAAQARHWQLPLTEEQVRQLAESSDGLRAALGQLQRLRHQASRDGSLAASSLTPLVEQLCREMEAVRPSLWEQVLEQVCAVFGVSRRELLGPSRLGRVLLPRQLAMYLLRQAGWSLPQLARAFDRDHATVLHACRKVEQRLQTDASLWAALRRVQARLH